MDKEFQGSNSLPPSPNGNDPTTASMHLKLEQLADYHFGKLSSDDASLVREHLVKCRVCASELIGLAAFCDPEEDDLNQPSPDKIASAWAELQATTHSASPPPRSSRTTLFERLSGWILPQRLAYGVAALSIALSLLLCVWVISLNRENQTLLAQLNQGRSAHEQEKFAAQNERETADKEIQEARQQRDEARQRVEQLEAQADAPAQRRESGAQLSVAIANFTVPDARTRGDSKQQQVYPIELPEGIAGFIITIPWFELEPIYSDYAIEIKNQNRATILSGNGLHYDEKQGFMLFVPRRLFPAGIYDFSIYGLSGGKKTLLQKGAASISYKKTR